MRISPDERDEFWFNEHVEAHAHQLLGSEEFIGRVSREDLLKLHPPLLTVARGDGDNVRGSQTNQLLKTNGINVWEILELFRLCVYACA